MYEQCYTTYFTMFGGNSKIINRSRKSKGRQYDSLFIYIPSNMTKDNTFPFRSDEENIIRLVFSILQWMHRKYTFDFNLVKRFDGTSNCSRAAGHDCAVASHFIQYSIFLLSYQLLQLFLLW